jgi:hypothetical protein
VAHQMSEKFNHLRASDAARVEPKVKIHVTPAMAESVPIGLPIGDGHLPAELLQPGVRRP